MKYWTNKYGMTFSDVEDVDNLRNAEYFVFTDYGADPFIRGFTTYEKAKEYLDVIEKENRFHGTFDHYITKAVERRTTGSEE